MRLERQRPTIASYGISIAEARDTLFITHIDDSALIKSYLSAATQDIEEAASIAILDQTIVLVLDEWPDNADDICLPIGPAQSVTAITVNGTAFTDFTLTNGVVRPTADTVSEGEVIVTYLAGFGPDDTTTPDNLRTAIAAQTQWHYDQMANKTGQALAPFTLRVIGQYRRVGL